ncbi:hypothetical protein KUDE01_018274, partial [Dissostichus eleginoides]
MPDRHSCLWSSSSHCSAAWRTGLPRLLVQYRERTCCSGVPDGRHEGPGLHWSLALESTGAPTSTGNIPQHSSPAQPPTTLQPILNGITKKTQPEQKHVTNEYDNKQHSSRYLAQGPVMVSRHPVLSPPAERSQSD